MTGGGLFLNLSVCLFEQVDRNDQTVSRHVMPGGIFISYRREDSPGTAGRLFDRLSAFYERERLFLDVDDIEPGMDFVTILTERVASCEVLIVIIGRNWLDAKDESGKRRLDSPYDFVHLEVKAALDRNVRTIPLLVDQAPMPPEEKLPPPLRALARRQAIRLGHDRFFSDSENLLRVLTKLVPVKGDASELQAAPPSVQEGIPEVHLANIISALSPSLSGKTRAYVAPTIPQNKELNARAAWGMPADEEIYVLFDNTLFGSAKNFIAVCTNGIYCRYSTERYFISFDEFRATVIRDAQNNSLMIGKRAVFMFDEFIAKRNFLVDLQKALRKAPAAKLPSSNNAAPKGAART